MRKKFDNLKKNGFTLVELLIGSLIMVFVVGALYFFWSYWKDGLAMGIGSTQASDDAFRAVSTITTNLRTIKNGDGGQYPLEQADDQAITFYADIDNDEAVERVRYYLSGQTLYEGIIEPSGSPATYDAGSEQVREWASFIANESLPVFYYYNQDWPEDTVNNPLATNRTLETAFIRVEVMVYLEGVGSADPATITQGIHLRTLKSNY